jgi:hypothetical protein
MSENTKDGQNQESLLEYERKQHSGGEAPDELKEGRKPDQQNRLKDQENMRK